MSFILLIALTLQALAIFLLVTLAGRRWLTHTGILFVIMAFIFYGLSEIVQLIFPGHNIYRSLIDQKSVDHWILIVSITILLFSLAYRFSFSFWFNRKRHYTNESRISAVQERQLNLKWMPFAALSMAGFITYISLDIEAQGYWISGLLEQFLLMSIIITSFCYLLKNRRRFFWVALVQSLLLVIIGSRLSVVAALIVLLAAAFSYGISIRFRHLLATGLMIIIAALAISAVRATYGRESFTGTFSERFRLLESGVSDLSFKNFSGSSILDDFVYRFDGNAFSALMLHRLDEGYALAGIQPLLSDLYLSIPRFVSTTKLDRDVSTLGEKSYLIMHYELFLNIDYLPTTLGVLYGCFGISGLFILGIVLGSLFAVIDHWLINRISLFSILVRFTLTYCIIFMEQGVSVYVLTFRGIAVLYIVLLIVRRLSGAIKPRKRYQVVGEFIR